MANNNQAKFSSTNPHFFKIILQETLEEDKLRIPHKFVMKYGETLSNMVSVKLPCGSEWEMMCHRHNDGKVWLKMGWPEFLKHYSIQKGDLIVFRYEGNSKFHAVICDTTTVEIDYPSVPAHVKSGIDSNPPANFVEILDDSSPHGKRAEKPPLQCSSPHKRTRISPTGFSQGNTAHSRPEGSKTALEKPKGKQDFPVENDTAKHTITGQKRSETIRCMKPLKETERTAALQKARNFTSEHPFVKVLLQSNSAPLTFPPEFARKYLKNNSNAILKVLDGRTWPLKYHFETHHGSSTARFHSGWKDFARDNNLGVGDVCVFVLCNCVKILFEVIIFHDSENSKAPMSPAESEEGLFNGTESCGMSSSQENPPANQANGCKSIIQKANLNSKPKAFRKQCGRTGNEKAGILERIAFESPKPFFKAFMQPSYIAGLGCSMPVPFDFARTYIRNYKGDVLLSVPNAGRWLARLHTRSVKSGRFTPRISSGWNKFVEDNNLQVGDVCIFELVARITISFQVFIIRRGDYDTNL